MNPAPETRFIGYRLKQAQHLLRLRIDEELRAHAITMPQYVAMLQISTSPGIPNAEIARRAFVTPQTMHRIIAGLQQNGLIDSHRSPHNQHTLLQTLTAEGECKLSQAHHIAVAIESEMLAGLTEAEVDALDRIVSRMIANLSPQN